MKSRRDPNEPEIIEGLRAHGAVAVQLDGKGLPDILVLYFTGIHLMEIKSEPGPRGGKSRSGQRLRKSQEEFIAKAERVGVKVWVVSKLDEALRAIGAVLPVEEG